MEAGIGWQLPQDVGIEAGALRTATRLRFGEATAGATTGVLAIVAVRKQLTEHLRVSGVYYGDYNDTTSRFFNATAASDR